MSVSVEVRVGKDVLRLDGISAICASLQTKPEEDLFLSDPAVVSLRAPKASELVVLLGSIIAAVRAEAPIYVDLAVSYANALDANRPIMRRMVDPGKGGG